MGSMRPSYIVAAALGALALSSGACGDPNATGPLTETLTLAKGGSPTSDPAVSSVDPDSSIQDTTLDILVFGSGFDAGSAVAFERGGVTSEKVRTNATTFLTPKKLRANVTIFADADTGAYDVAVSTSDGRRGIGIEMFEVLERVEATFGDGVTDGLVSDGGGLYPDASIADFFSLSAKAETQRKLCFAYHGQVDPADVGFSDQPDAALLCTHGYLTTSVNNYQEDNVTPGVRFVDMAIGSVQRGRLGGVYVRDGYNWSFKYGRDCNNVDVPAERSVITRLSSREWTIEATTMTMCKVAVKGPTRNPNVASGLLMPVRITVAVVTATP